MKYIELPDQQKRRLSFYLAMEEYVACHVLRPDEGVEGDCFFMWQVEPSVIFGRNQLMENEVNLKFCQEHGISIFRRKSGGGCVYADLNNVMFSYITAEENVGFTFNRYINMIVHVLQRLGIDARSTGRNDIMVGDCKVSGNAFYKMRGRSIVHGTMLYDTDMLNMVGSITPTDAKLLSKGIVSVRQRIALLKDFTHLTLDEFKQYVREHLCDAEVKLTAADVSAIEELEQEFLSPEFIYGNNPRYTLVRQKRIEGVGDFEVRMELKNNIICSINLMGDYFLVGDLDRQLLDKLKGLPLEHAAISRALPDRIDDVIMNLDKEDFVNILTQE